jgi:hypothetical protein
MNRKTLLAAALENCKREVVKNAAAKFKDFTASCLSPVPDAASPQANSLNFSSDGKRRASPLSIDMSTAPNIPAVKRTKTSHDDARAISPGVQKAAAVAARAVMAAVEIVGIPAMVVKRGNRVNSYLDDLEIEARRSLRLA